MIPAAEDLAATIFVPVDGGYDPFPLLAVGDAPLPGLEDSD